jgi:hypothetical protein
MQGGDDANPTSLTRPGQDGHEMGRAMIFRRPEALHAWIEQYLNDAARRLETRVLREDGRAPEVWTLTTSRTYWMNNGGGSLSARHKRTGLRGGFCDASTPAHEGDNGCRNWSEHLQGEG